MHLQHTSRCSMQHHFTLPNLPRVHSADKSVSFALNYPKYFPKAPGSASKSFYRQKMEAQRAEGENGEKGGHEGQRRGRKEQQQRVKVGGPMQRHDRVNNSALTSRRSNEYQTAVCDGVCVDPHPVDRLRGFIPRLVHPGCRVQNLDLALPCVTKAKDQVDRAP